MRQFAIQIKKKKKGSLAISQKPHAVLVPFPAQGHVIPFMRLAKLLHAKGFFITFVNTEFNHKRLIKSEGPDSVKGLEDFKFETIPDGLPPSDKDATQDPPAICDSTGKNCLVPFKELLVKLNSCSEVPPVGCVISDGLMNSRNQILVFLEFNFGLLLLPLSLAFCILESSSNEESSLLKRVASKLVCTRKCAGAFSSWRILSHCGWNSITESICAGVPVICWPFFADQTTNCHYACDKWGIGMEINHDVKREEVSALVREMMVGERGKQMRLKAQEWKKKAEKATYVGGSSYNNFDRFIREALHFKG